MVSDRYLKATGAGIAALGGAVLLFGLTRDSGLPHYVATSMGATLIATGSAVYFLPVLDKYVAPRIANQIDYVLPALKRYVIQACELAESAMGSVSKLWKRYEFRRRFTTRWL